MKKKLYDIVRNREVWGYLASIAVMIVLSLAFFHPDAVEGNSLQQGDLIQGAANSHEIEQYREQTGKQSFWTNSLFSGMPAFQISPQYESDSLFNWINVAMRAGLPEPSGYLFSMMLGFLIMCACLRMRWYYALIGSIAWGFSSYFIIIIGAGHLWKFFTLTYVPPVIGGVIMAYQGRLLQGTAVTALFAMMQIAANHVQMSYYFLFLILGLAIAFLVRAVRQNAVARWFYATSCLLGAGVLAVAANSPSLYNTYLYSKETIRGQHSLLTDGTAASSGLDKDYITQYSYGQAESFTLLIPNVKGGATVKPVGGRLEPLNLSQLPDATQQIADGKIDPLAGQYLQYVSQYFGEPEGTNGPVYVGAVVCMLFLLGCCIVRGPVKWTLLTLTVLSILLAMGRNCMWLTDFFIYYVPMYKNFRTPESILVIAEFCMPLLAVLGLAQFFKTERPFHTYRRAVIFAIGLPAVLCLFGIFFPGIFGDVVTVTDQRMSAMIGHQLSAQGYPAEMVSQFSIDNPATYNAVIQLRHGLIEADSWRSLIFILVAAAALWCGTLKVMPKWVAIAAVGCLITADLYTADKRYLSHDSFTSAPAIANSFTPTEADRLIMSDTAMNYRVLDVPRFWQPSPSYFHKSVGGYHAAKLTRYQDLIDRHLGNFVQGQPDEADMNVVNMLNTRYIVMPGGQVIANVDALGNAWFVDNVEWVDNPDEEMDALSFIDPATTAVIDRQFKDLVTVPSAAADSLDTIVETTYAPDRLTYTSNAAGERLVLFSEVYFPWGWTAQVDGKEVPIVRANYLLRAINVPAGKHSIEFEFAPSSVANTVTVARVSIILIYVLVALAIGLLTIKINVRYPAGKNV